MCNLETGPETFQIVTNSDAEAAALKPFIGKSIALGTGQICYPSDGTMLTGDCTPGVTSGGTGLSRSVGTQVTYGFSAAFGVVQNRLDILVEAFGYADVTGNAKALPVEALGALKLYLARNSFFLAGAGAGVYGNGGEQTGSPREIGRAHV